MLSINKTEIKFCSAVSYFSRFTKLSAIFLFTLSSIFAQQTRIVTPAVETFQGQFISEANSVNKQLTLWYCRPAKDWNEDLAVGNGRLGAMIFGGTSGITEMFMQNRIKDGKVRKIDLRSPNKTTVKLFIGGKEQILELLPNKFWNWKIN